MRFFRSRMAPVMSEIRLHEFQDSCLLPRGCCHTIFPHGAAIRWNRTSVPPLNLFSLCCPDVISIVSTYTNYKMIIGFCGKKREFYVSAKICPAILVKITTNGKKIQADNAFYLPVLIVVILKIIPIMDLCDGSGRQTPPYRCAHSCGKTPPPGRPDPGWCMKTPLPPAPAARPCAWPA